MPDIRLGSGEIFPTDRPVAGAELIGRDDDVDAIAAGLLGGANVVVAGPRRIGKTSVCDAVLDVCRAEKAYTARVDLFEQADAEQLAEAIAVAVLANRPAVHRLLARARAVGGAVKNAADVSATVRLTQELGDGVALALAPRRADRDPAVMLRDAFGLPQRIAEADDRRFVLFLDEFQELASPRRLYGDPDVVTRQLRAALQRSPRVSTLFAGSIEHLMRDLFAPADRALSQFGGFHDLGRIADEAWREGFRARLALDSCTITDSALDRLLAVGAGHPRATMLIAQRAHALAVSELAHELDLARVETGVELAVLADRLKHEQTLERIRLMGRHAQRVAERVAHGVAPYSGLSPEAVRRTLAALRDAGVVDRGPGSREWHIGDPLLARYLRGLPGGGR